MLTLLTLLSMAVALAAFFAVMLTPSAGSTLPLPPLPSARWDWRIPRLP